MMNTMGSYEDKENYTGKATEDIFVLIADDDFVTTDFVIKKALIRSGVKKENIIHRGKIDALAVLLDNVPFDLILMDRRLPDDKNNTDSIVKDYMEEYPDKAIYSISTQEEQHIKTGVPHLGKDLYEIDPQVLIKNYKILKAKNITESEELSEDIEEDEEISQ